MWPGLYELLDAIIPEFEWVIDVRWLIAWVLIAVGFWGELRWWRRALRR